MSEVKQEVVVPGQSVAVEVPIQRQDLARVGQEVMAAITVAKRFPRDEIVVFNKIVDACKNRDLAEAALYTYKRGGQKVEGETIRLAEVMIQNWGNADSGIVELERTDTESHMQAFCYDLERNVRSSRQFIVRHQRYSRDKGNVKFTEKDDQREIYELTANLGSRRLRACILQIIPREIKKAAVEQVKKTLLDDSEMSMKERLRRMVAVFEKYNVTQEMIENKLGHKIDECIPNELVELQGIFNAIREGYCKVDEHFGKADTVSALETMLDDSKDEPRD